MAKVGDRVRIINMSGEPSYSGRTGMIECIDDIGQLHGTWGGLAVVPNEDEFEIIKTEKCCICKKEYTGYGNNPAPFGGDRCCDECNQNYVVPLRIYAITKEPTSAVWFKADGTVQTVKPKDTYFTLSELQGLVGGLIELTRKDFMDILLYAMKKVY